MELQPVRNREGVVKHLWMIAATAIAFAMPAHAQGLQPPASGIAGPAAMGDAEILIYRVVGVRDDGGAIFAGVATSLDCTNFSGATETVRFVARSFSGVLKANVTIQIAHLETRGVVTHHTNGIQF